MFFPLMKKPFSESKKVLNAAETDKQELGLLMAGIGAAEKSPADGEAEE